MVAQETPSGVVVRVFHSLTGLLYRPVSAELDRRRGVGLGALAQLPLLDGLLGLPVGLPVEWQGLTMREQQLMATAPAGVLRRQGRFVVREAVPPLIPQLAVVAAGRWCDGLVQAGRFAPYCARVLLVPDSPPEWQRTEAAYWGVGVGVLVGSGQVELVVDPQPYRPRRFTPAKWWFAEEIHRQVTGRFYSSVDGQAGRLAHAVSARGGTKAARTARLNWPTREPPRTG